MFGSIGGRPPRQARGAGGRVIALAVTLGCALTLLPGSGATQTNWPDFQDTLLPGPSLSELKAELPADVAVAPAAPGTPLARAKLLGYWGGWVCPGAVGDTRVAFVRIEGDDVALLYAYASSTYAVPPYIERIGAKFHGDEVHGAMANGGQLIYRLRRDQNLDVMWRSGEMWCTGILAAMPSPTAEMRVQSLCGGNVLLAFAGMDTREGIYLGSWRDLRSATRLCAGLAIERIFDDGTAQIVYFYGADTDWGAPRPGFRRTRNPMQDDIITAPGQSFKLMAGKIQAIYGREMPGTFIKQ